MAITRVTQTVIGEEAVSGAKLANGTITSVKIANEAITADKLGANAVSAGSIGANLALVETRTNLVNANLTLEAANTAAIKDATTDLDIGSGKYFFDKSESSLGIANTPTAFGTAPVNTLVLGTPANVLIRATGGSGVAKGGNVILGADLTTATTSHTLDVQSGSANFQNVTAVGAVNVTTSSGRPLTLTTSVQTNDDPLRIDNTVEQGNVLIHYRNSHGTDTNYKVGLFEPSSSFQHRYRSGDTGAYSVYLHLDPTMKFGVGTASPSANLHVVGTGKFTDQVTMDDDLIVTGNLQVLGTTTTVNTDSLVIQDHFLMLANGVSGSPSLDSGMFFNRGNQGNAALYYDESAKGYRLAETTSPISNSLITNDHVTRSANLVVGNVSIETLSLNGTEITSSGSELNILDGVTATTAELNYVDGVSSAIQTQLDAKATTASFQSNDFITFTRLNANVNTVQGNVDIVQDNVASLTGGGVLLRPFFNTTTQTGTTANTFFIGKAIPGDGLANIVSVAIDGVFQRKDQPGTANNDFIVNAASAHASIKFTAPSIPAGSIVTTTILF